MLVPTIKVHVVISCSICLLLLVVICNSMLTASAAQSNNNNNINSILKAIQEGLSTDYKP
jgi:NADH:ubiquinone oxidoreductase subunit 6 (subunit J)